MDEPRSTIFKLYYISKCIKNCVLLCQSFLFSDSQAIPWIYQSDVLPDLLLLTIAHIYLHTHTHACTVLAIFLWDHNFSEINKISTSKQCSRAHTRRQGKPKKKKRRNVVKNLLLSAKCKKIPLNSHSLKCLNGSFRCSIHFFPLQNLFSWVYKLR